ncbi:MAG: ABC transporter permease [Candidatus Thorarchaeota archaeon]|nr:ABC transporter permease [Candidatus Thorarchaeota archaeon]
MLREIAAIVRKDLKQAKRDPRFVAPSLIVPFVLALVYAIMWAQVGGGESFVCGLVVEDSSTQAEDMALILENMVSTTNHTWFKMSRYDSATAMDLFQSGELIAYVLIPEGFGVNITAGIKAVVVIYIVNLNDDVVKNYVHRIEAAVLLYNQGAIYPEYDQSDARVALNETLNLDVTPSNLAYMYAVAVVLSVIVCSVTGQALATASDFETKAVYDTLNSPTSRIAIVVAHTIAAIPRSLFVLLITVPVILLGTGTLPAGNPVILGLILLLSILVLVPIGDIIGLRSKKRETAILFSVLFSVVCFLAGGGLAPIGLMPRELRALVMMLPTTHSISMWARVFFYDTMSGLLFGMVALLTMWIVFTLLSTKLMAQEVERS